jgi:hypothetical protein
MNLIFLLAAWSLVFSVVLSTVQIMRDGFQVAKRMHKIPCPNCQFFTGNHYLKCTVHPSWALTEEAIHCSDFCPLAGKVALQRMSEKYPNLL